MGARVVPHIGQVQTNHEKGHPPMSASDHGARIANIITSHLRGGAPEGPFPNLAMADAITKEILDGFVLLDRSEDSSKTIERTIRKAEVRAWCQGYVSGHHDRGREMKLGPQAASTANPYEEQDD